MVTLADRVDAGDLIDELRVYLADGRLPFACYDARRLVARFFNLEGAIARTVPGWAIDEAATRRLRQCTRAGYNLLAHLKERYPT